MKNKELKRKLIQDGTEKNYRKRKNQLYKDLFTSDEIDQKLIEEFGEENQKALKQLLQQRKQQKQKVFDHVKYWFNNDYDIYFFTFTYSDDKRKKEMTPETLKKYCIRALENADDYAINIDYGDKTGRLHYHALVAYKQNNPYKCSKLKDFLRITGQKEEAEKIKNDRAVIFQSDQNHIEYTRKVGNIYIEKANKTTEDFTKLSRYMSKLVHHSIKVKQKYISTKKGTDYQKFKSLYQRTLRINKNDCEEHEKNISLYNTIKTTPKLLEEYQKLGYYKDIEIIK